MFTKYKKLIITVVVIAIAFFVYGKFFTSDETSSNSLLSSSQSTNPETSAEVLGADIIRAINQIDSLSLDRSVFDNEVLKELIDRSEEIQPESIGKTNPFSPISFSTEANTETVEGAETEGPEDVVEGQN